jgi:predicted secreted protein
MTLPIGLAIYFTIWWIVLFAVLPFGVRSQHEGADMIPGTDPGAPVAPRLLLKAAITTVVACVLFAGLWWYMTNQ